MRGLWGNTNQATRFDWNTLFSALISKGLKPFEIAELTLTEALLYTVATEKPGVSVGYAIAKAKMFKSLPVEDKINLAVLRSGG